MTVLVWNSWITSAGGMERVALSIANGLAGKGVRVLLVGPYEKVPVLREAIDPSVEFIPCEFERSLRGMVRNLRFLRETVRKHQVDVVSAHGSLFPLLGLPVPVVWTEHGPRYGAEKILKGPKAMGWRLVQQNLRSGKWKFVACSRYVRDRVCSELDLSPDRAYVIYNGVPNAEALQKLPLPQFQKPYRVGFLGRLEPEKHPLDIFTLDQLLAQRGVFCKWNVFGEGSLRSVMEHKARGNPRIHIRGLAAHASAALEEMDILTFLSHGDMEGLPTVILEARLARRPVVAWKVTANPEAAGADDVLVSQLFDLNKFAAAIENVLSRRSIPEPVTTEISFDQMIRDYAAVLDHAGKSSGNKSRSAVQQSAA